MNKNILIIAFVVILAGVGGYLLFGSADSGMDGVVEEKLTAEQEEAAAIADEDTELKSIVSSYMGNFEMSAPPESDAESAEKAYALLTERAQNLKEEGTSTSAFLAQFSGVQDLPDEGYEITSITTGPGNTKEVNTTWNYSGGDVAKTFYLESVDDIWLIDSIQDVR